MERSILTPALLTLALLTIALLINSNSKDTFIGNILNDNYNKKKCTNENRYYPMGKIPGSYLGLTEAEKQGLLKDFINNNVN